MTKNAPSAKNMSQKDEKSFVQSKSVTVNEFFSFPFADAGVVV